MSKINCEACDDLKTYAPDFVANGVTKNVCTSLKNDTGLGTNGDHTDCDDLDDANDCLIGQLGEEIDSYDVCEWREYMHRFVPNVHTMLKAIICAICGIWIKIHEHESKIACVYNGLKNLINQLGSTTQGTSFVRYYRDNSGTGEGYLWSVSAGSAHNLDIYMDANVDNPGSKAADRDYIVMITYCCDFANTSLAGLEITPYSSGDTRGIETIRKRQAQHPDMYLPQAVTRFSWPCSGAVLIKKGEHLKINSYCYTGSSGQYRLHQFVLTWIPVNASGSFDPGSILPC